MMLLLLLHSRAAISTFPLPDYTMFIPIPIAFP